MIPRKLKAQLKQMGLPGDQEMIRRARLFAMESGMTWIDMAEMAGLNPSSLRVYMSGHYDKHQGADSNTLLIRAALKQCMDRYEHKRGACRGGRHYSTAEFEDVRASMLSALSDGSAVLVDGPPGIGKSWVLERVTAEINSNKLGRAFYVYCTIGLSPQSFLVECCTVAGIPNRGTKMQILRKLAYFFEEEHPLLVIDEAQNLPFETLETLRRLFDVRGYGIVLAASYDLLARIRDYKMRMWESRLERAHLLQGATRAEAAAILAGELGPISDGIVDQAVKDATDSASRKIDEKRWTSFDYISLRKLFWNIRGARREMEAIA